MFFELGLIQNSSSSRLVFTWFFGLVYSLVALSLSRFTATYGIGLLNIFVLICCLHMRPAARLTFMSSCLRSVILYCIDSAVPLLNFFHAGFIVSGRWPLWNHHNSIAVLQAALAIESIFDLFAACFFKLNLYSSDVGSSTGQYARSVNQTASLPCVIYIFDAVASGVSKIIIGASRLFASSWMQINSIAAFRFSFSGKQRPIWSKV